MTGLRRAATNGFPLNLEKARGAAGGLLIAGLLWIAGFLILDALFPFSQPAEDADFAVMVTAANGAPLRSFPDKNGVWRYPADVSQVSPRYIEALINYEDRWFRYHPGVNPWALARGLYLYVKHGRVISGGSTLTMQAARIRYPHSRTIPGKLYQIFRALQLERHFTKDDILNLYLNYAPFGGPIEGVQAASFSYLGKSAAELSHAEAALLAVLPQSPTRLRPDRHPDRAENARNKILNRMGQFGVWDPETVAEAKKERVAARFAPHPMTAPLLARRLRPLARPLRPIRTCIDAALQQMLEEMVLEFIRDTPDHTSAAVLVADNETLGVKAYVGSADFLDNSRFGHVDMIQAVRSPGSTLKPFLYAFALEEGLIHSESLLVDAPFSFKGYRPDNFTQGFSGPVSAAEALQRSLNIPAVDLLDRLGPKFFDARLRQGGLKLKYPPHQDPNLTTILGGVGVTLEELVGAFSAFAREGLAGRLRYTMDAPLKERRLMRPGAAYIIRQILQEHHRPDLPSGRLALDRSRQAAWKTGTSYGFRDAWTVGVTDQYTIGVWVGRPDGTPSPGQYGRATAAPLLFMIVDSLPRRRGASPPIPASVTREEICWPLGVKPEGENDPLCHVRRHAWVLNQVIPPTLPDRTDRHWTGNPVTVMINPATGLRAEADCPVPNPRKKIIARWPKPAAPWLSPRVRAASRIPKLDPVCGKPVSAAAETINIMGVEPEAILRPPGSRTELPSITLQAQGGLGRLFWLINGELVAQTGVGETRLYQFTRPGRHKITVMDLGGNWDSVEVVVMGGG